MTPARARKERPPLDQHKLEELALRYVERFATTRARLRDYLRRKLRERGWKGDADPDLAAIADKFASLGYVDDAAYALNKARSLSGRGYGKRRLVQKLRVAGVEDADGEEPGRLPMKRRCRPRCASPSGAGWARSQRCRPDPARPRESARRNGPGRPRLRARTGHPRACAGAEIDPDALRERADRALTKSVCRHWHSC